jgi:hypothetical protein
MPAKVMRLSGMGSSILFKRSFASVLKNAERQCACSQVQFNIQDVNITAATQTTKKRNPSRTYLPKQIVLLSHELVEPPISRQRGLKRRKTGQDDEQNNTAAKDVGLRAVVATTGNHLRRHVRLGPALGFERRTHHVLGRKPKVANLEQKLGREKQVLRSDIRHRQASQTP